MEINEILKAIKFYDKIYKREEIEAAIEKQEEITPYLIQILENVLKNPEKYSGEENPYYEHVYAIMLLGHFKEEKSHNLIIDIFSLPGDIPEQLYGDFVTGDLAVVLLRTCGGKTEGIKDLILNKNACEYCRGAAIEALSCAALEGYESRENVLDFYKGLFTGKEASASTNFHDVLAACVYDLYPDTLKETIDKAYEEGLIFQGYIAQVEFEEILKKDKEKCLSRSRAMLKSRQIDDLHKSMSWWACFEQPESKTLPAFLPNDLSLKINNKSNKKAKAKRKQSKKSKKANRKKKK